MFCWRMLEPTSWVGVTIHVTRRICISCLISHSLSLIGFTIVVRPHSSPVQWHLHHIRKNRLRLTFSIELMNNILFSKSHILLASVVTRTLGLPILSVRVESEPHYLYIDSLENWIELISCLLFLLNRGQVSSEIMFGCTHNTSMWSYHISEHLKFWSSQK